MQEGGLKIVLGKCAVQIDCEVFFCTVMGRKTTTHFWDYTVQLTQRIALGTTQFQETKQNH